VGEYSSRKNEPKMLTHVVFRFLFIFLFCKSIRFDSILQVTSQRQQYQEYTKGRPTPLTKQRKELLDEIGFQFRIRNRPEWSSKYEELMSYKEKNGDTRVPQHYKVNKALGKVRILKP
jgi:hypothetical protein